MLLHSTYQSKPSFTQMYVVALLTGCCDHSMLTLGKNLSGTVVFRVGWSAALNDSALFHRGIFCMSVLDSSNYVQSSSRQSSTTVVRQSEVSGRLCKREDYLCGKFAVCGSWKLQRERCQQVTPGNTTRCLHK